MRKIRICVPIMAKNSVEAMKIAREAKRSGADILELRIDSLANPSAEILRKIIKVMPLPVIATNRKRKGISENKRISLLIDAIDAGADYVDIEIGSRYVKEIIKNKKDAKVIVSHHNFQKTLNNLEEIYRKIKKLKPDIVKIATFANSLEDNFKILQFLEYKKNCIAFCMGELGVLSRAFCCQHGSFLTFASVGKKSAEGQISLNDMKFLIN